MAMDEPGLSLFRCICGRGIWALPSADIRCRCGGRIENAKVLTVMYEKAVHFEHKRPV
jgi:hypothetical protein